MSQKKSEDKKKAVIYCRQSSGNNEVSNSVIFQEKACREYARKKGYKILGVYSDLNTPGRLYPTGGEEACKVDEALCAWFDTHSTEKKYRPGLGNALAMFPEIDAIIVYDDTRLCRPVTNSYLANFLINKMEKFHVQLVSLKDGACDFTKLADVVVNNVRNMINDNQIKLNREKSIKALEALRDDGYYSTAPRMYGIKYIGGKERSIEIIPEQAEVIKFVFENVLKRRKYADILKDMNTLFKGRYSGKNFYDSSWRHIIANPFYCGYMYDSNGALIRAKQMIGKELVTYEDWEKANEIVNNPLRPAKQRKNLTHEFSGIVECGYCGSKLSVFDDRGKIGYSCFHGVNVRHNEECRGSRLLINLVRKSENFTGLKEAISPLLLLSLFKRLDDRSDAPELRRKLEALNIKKRNIEEKMNKLSDSYYDGNIDEKAFARGFTDGEKKVTDVINEITLIKLKLENSEDQEKRAKEYFEMVDKVMNNQLEIHVFKDLLYGSIKKIYSFYDHIDIDTIYGMVPMKRYLHNQYRNFPKFTYEIISKCGKRKIVKLDDCIIKVTYLYDDSNKEELIVDLEKMQFFQK